MHELAICQALMNQIETIATERNASHVVSIVIGMGPLSGVEPLLLRSAFKRLAQDRTVADASLELEEVSLLAACNPCQCEFEVRKFVFRCPKCGGNVRVIRGDELQLVSVSLDHKTSGAELAS